MSGRELVVRVMADYGCFPLWGGRADHPGDLDPRLLPITSTLAADLLAWARAYDDTLDRADPAASGFPTPEHEAGFHRRGAELARELARQLPAPYRVRYFDGRTGRMLDVG